MIIQYVFDTATAEEISRTYSQINGPVTYEKKQMIPKTRELVAMTVSEGRDAEREIVDWRQSLKSYQRVLDTGMPNWLFWAQ